MKQIILTSAVILACGLGVARAHEGHAHGPEQADTGPASGPITLTETSIRNLGIETVDVDLAPLQRSLRMAARIQGLPEKQAKISPRAEGRVAEIFVKLGDRIASGQPLVRFEPLTVGNPPVVLKSPIDGFVIRQETALGQLLRPETVVMEVADYAQVLARAMTFESPDLSAIKAGQSARVTLAVFGDQVFEGKVQRLDVGLEKESGTFDVYVLLDNAELKLRPNMQATVTLGLGQPQDALAVPERAVLGDLGNHFVFVQTEPNVFERRNVVLGTRAGEQIEIIEGVLPGDKVVTRGNYQLQFATSTAANAAPAEEHDHAEAGGGPAPPGLRTWLWALGGFLAGGLIFGLLMRRSPA